MKKSAVISGGTTGIGRSIVEALLVRKYRVFTCSSDQKNVNSLIEWANANHFGHQLTVSKVNMANKEEVCNWAMEIFEKSKTIDLLINNAGTFKPGGILTEEDGSLEFLLNVNVVSAYYLTRYILPSIPINQSGCIVNICSVASVTPYVNGVSYGASKFALYGFSKSLREELKPKGIKVIAVLPGATLTRSWDGVNLPDERFINPTDLAELIAHVVEMPATAVVEELLIRPMLGDI